MKDSWIDIGMDKEIDSTGNCLVDYVKGSTAEERRNPKRSNRQRAYNKSRSECLKKFKDFFTLRTIISDPDLFSIKLSEAEALYPNLNFELSLNIQEITESKIKKQRAILFWYIFKENQSWIDFYFEEAFTKIFDPEKLFFNKVISMKKSKEYGPQKEYTEELQEKLRSGKVQEYSNRFTGKKYLVEYFHSPQIEIKTQSPRFFECVILYQQLLILGKESCKDLIKIIYSEDNIKKYCTLGGNLIKSNFCFVKIPKYEVKEKVFRRGYKETSSNKHKTKNQEERIMKSEESRELEKTIERIKLKQAMLFEQRLDTYLALAESPVLSKVQIKDLFQNLLIPESQNFTDTGISFIEEGDKQDESKS